MIQLLIISGLVLIIIGLIIILYMYIVKYNDTLNLYNELEPKFKHISSRITFIRLKLQEIDANGHFESDDEIGFFFTEIKSFQLLLDEFNALFYEVGQTDYVKRMQQIKNELNQLRESETNIQQYED